MKLRILCISVLITFVGILAYSFVSTELFYDSSLGRMRETLAVYMNAFDEDKYSALGEEEAESLSVCHVRRIQRRAAAGAEQ